ncbi:flavin reductase family protein [Microbacterium caowuchunii]|uniref:Flavin reductase family protein n=1 Tax=Microbacterium caowuchunii TaxID=2614638 RepID=A0A5N0TLC5_9MICO|nr:flavin reductase family protein [Microbacterium caowuchunii]KAA9134947.1 flavin reductase family protein [Microbacterium caowuchunii]
MSRTMVASRRRLRGRPLTADQFKVAFRLHPGGVALVTADAGDGPVALTASSLASVSASPPIFMFSVSMQSSSTATVRASTTLVVHMLDAATQDLAELGAASGIDRFRDESSWDRLDTGEPVFPAARAWIRGRVLHRVDAGGSTVIVAEGVESNIGDDHVERYGERDGLVYVNRSWHAVGSHTRLPGR